MSHSVNDLVIQTDLVPQQSEEDGLNIIVDFIVIDPEKNWLLRCQESMTDLESSCNPRVVLIDPQHWNGAEIIEFDVSDGESKSIIVTVPINIGS